MHLVKISALALLCWSVVACERFRPEPVARERRIVTTAWDTLWTAGTSDNLSVLEPEAMAGGRENVYVMDWAGRQLVALRAATGGVAWKAGRPGAGPGEFQQPSAVTITAQGDIAVLDLAARRIVVFASDGSFRRTVSLLLLPDGPEAFCALPSGNFAVAVVGRDSLVEVNEAGVMLGGWPRPWSVSDPTGLANQVLMASDARAGSCGMVMVLGSGYSHLTPRGFILHSSVEQIDPPQLLRSRTGRLDSLSHRVIASAGVAARGDSLFVLFHGRSDLAGRVIDIYDMKQGRYLATWLLPARAGRFTLAGDALIVRFRQEDDSDALVALRPKS
jgi:hypothetical protein